MLDLVSLPGSEIIRLDAALQKERRYAYSPTWKGDLQGDPVLVVWDYSTQEFKCRWGDWTDKHFRP